MEYFTINIVPRPQGWYATVSVRSTRAVRGVPRTLGKVKDVLVESTSPLDARTVYENVLEALGGAARPSR